MDWLEGIKLIRDEIMKAILENWWIIAIMFGGLAIAVIICVLKNRKRR